MRLTLCKMCQFAGRLQSGSPIVVGIFSRLAVPAFPSQLDPSYLAIEIETPPVETGQSVEIGVRLIDEDGHQLTEWSALLELPPSYEYVAMRTFLDLPIPWDDQFVFSRPGTYRFDVVSQPNTDQEEILGGDALIVHQRKDWMN